MYFSDFSVAACVVVTTTLNLRLDIVFRTVLLYDLDE